MAKWSLKIDRISNGYCLSKSNGDILVIEEDLGDKLKEHEELLWEIMEYFNFQGSKHDEERLRIIREKGETNVK